MKAPPARSRRGFSISSLRVVRVLAKLSPMKNTICKGVALGISLMWELDCRAAQAGTSRSTEIAKYVDLALDARRLITLTPNKHLDDVAHGPGRATVWLEPELWAQIETTASRLETSLSEAVRVLVLGGFAAAEAAGEKRLTSTAVRAKALRILATPRSSAEFSKAMWPKSDRRASMGACRRLLLELVRIGLVSREGRPARWVAVKVGKTNR